MADPSPVGGQPGVLTRARMSASWRRCGCTQRVALTADRAKGFRARARARARPGKV